MRHRKKGRKLNRTASHKKALMRNLANQLFEHKEIRTTTAKAKEARSTVERLITYAKKGDLHHRRLAFSFLRQKATIKMLFEEIAPSYSDRQGGYTRIIKLGKRLGDGAPMSMLQLVGFETLGESVKADKKKKTRKKEEKSIAAQESRTEEKPEESTITEQEEKNDSTTPVDASEEQPADKAVEEKEEAAEEEKEKPARTEPEKEVKKESGDSEDKSDPETETDAPDEPEQDKDKS